jgi:hypothetical protein
VDVDVDVDVVVDVDVAADVDVVVRSGLGRVRKRR